MGRIVFLFGLIVLAGCETKLSFLAEAVVPSSESKQILIDGQPFTFISYSSSKDAKLKPIFFIGGSGCVSLRTYIGKYFSSLPKGLKIYALEKKGVKDRSLGLQCKPAFWNGYTYENLKNRNIKALQYIKNKYPDEKISLFGTSEGGVVALEIDSLVVIGAGALPQRQELRILFQNKEQEHQLKSIFERIQKNPQSLSDFEMGFPNKYWSSILDIDPRLFVSKILAPSLILIGARDSNVPVASAQLADTLIPNSRLVIWPDANHIFNTPDGRKIDDVIERAGLFLLNK